MVNPVSALVRFVSSPAKPSVFFRFVARLMMSVPDAGLMDMPRIMGEVTGYQQYIDQLPQLQKDFQSKTFTQTKEQIRYRLDVGCPKR